MFGDGPLTLYIIENSENTLMYMTVLIDGALGLHSHYTYMYINGLWAIKFRKTWLF